jgi:biofilm protein TabA
MSVEKNINEVISRWFHAGEWKNGLKLRIHESADIGEFYLRYNKNKVWWDKAFAFLRDTDLENLAPGKYVLDEDHVYASVSEAATKNFEDTKWEAHRQYIDIQYVISGAESMGVAPLTGSTELEPFDPIKDLGFYNVLEDECIYYPAAPGTFFIFFPHDAHRPCIRTEGTDWDKKVVIKVKVG